MALQAISVQSFLFYGLLSLNCRYLVGVTSRDQAVDRTNFVGCMYCICEYRPMYELCNIFIIYLTTLLVAQIT